MSTIIGQINLMKFNGARRVTDGRSKGIFIPVAENPTIFDGAKGAYASIRIVEKASDFNDIHYTHFIALDLQKDKRDQLRESLGEEGLRALTPILGNLREYKAPAPEYQPTELHDPDNGLASPDGFQEQPHDLPF